MSSNDQNIQHLHLACTRTLALVQAEEETVNTSGILFLLVISAAKVITLIIVIVVIILILIIVIIVIILIIIAIIITIVAVRLGDNLDSDVNSWPFLLSQECLP